MRKANIYNIPADQDFILNLAYKILEDTKDSPLGMADYNIILPSIDACDLLKSKIIDLSGDKPVILPNIGTPGDIDGDELSLKLALSPELSSEFNQIPPAISSLHRNLLLAKEIMKIPEMASSPQKAIQLGSELGNFLNQLQKNEIELKELGNISEKSKFWKQTSDFLEVLTKEWPLKLQELNLTDPEIRKNTIIDIQAKYLQEKHDNKPIIIAGFNDTTPAISRLIQTISKLKNGVVLLSGLEKSIDNKTWKNISETHPQYGLKNILDNIGVKRNKVENLPTIFERDKNFVRAPNLQKTVKSRRTLLNEAMRPPATSEAWNKLVLPSPKSRKKIDEDRISIKALTGMDLINCGTGQEEASVIALKMREALEVEGREASLITPDRSLARRVSARLRHWDIQVPDSAGTSLDNSFVGSFIKLTADMVVSNLAPIPFLECLKHPLACNGQEKPEFNKRLNDLEDLILRGPRPASGFDGMLDTLSAKFNSKSRHFKTDDMQDKKENVTQLIAELREVAEPFINVINNPNSTFSEILDQHILFAENLVNTTEEQGSNIIWSGEDGIAAARFLRELREYSDEIPNLKPDEYVSLLQGLMQNTNVKPRAEQHPRLKILSPAQARLSKSDIVILGGLNDNKWPSKLKTNPWLSKKMLKDLNLPLPDIAVGNASYDFVQFASNPNVLMTRSMRDGTSPTVQSPILNRLQMVLSKLGLQDNLASKTKLAEINESLSTPRKITPIKAPEPRPDAKYRPTKLPVTAIEKLLRDPYSLYAQYILKLYPKAPIDAEPNYAERGMIIHEALEKFVNKYPYQMPENGKEELLEIGRKVFDDRMDSPSVRAFWWPRFERIVDWFIVNETKRREDNKNIGTELQGKIEIETDNGQFILTAIADRIDRLENDLLSIIDYKTGGIPTQVSVEQGFSPQLTLEALIASMGGFKGVDAGQVGELEYWKLSGGRPAGKITKIKADISRLEEEALEGLIDLISVFSDNKTPYLSIPRPRLAPRYSNSKHLARQDEWGKEKQVKIRKRRNKKASKRISKP